MEISKLLRLRLLVPSNHGRKISSPTKISTTTRSVTFGFVINSKSRGQRKDLRKGRKILHQTKLHLNFTKIIHLIALIHPHKSHFFANQQNFPTRLNETQDRPNTEQRPRRKHVLPEHCIICKKKEVYITDQVCTRFL